MLTENRITKLLYIEDDLIDVLAFERHIKKANFKYKYQIANTINEAWRDDQGLRRYVENREIPANTRCDCHRVDEQIGAARIEDAN